MKELLIMLLGSFLTILSCTTGRDKYPALADNIAVTWELTGTRGGQSTASFVFENKGKSTLGNTDWNIYFNQVGAGPGKAHDSSLAVFEHVNGDFFRLRPGNSFTLKPGGKVVITYDCNGRIIKESHAPEGMYFVFHDGMPSEIPVYIRNYSVVPFTDLSKLGSADDAGGFSFPTPQSVYDANKVVTRLPPAKTGKIVPTPLSYIPGKGEVELSATDQIYYQADCKDEAEYLASALEKHTGVRITISEGDKTGINAITLKTQNINIKDIDREAYILKISGSSGVSITGSDRSGVFYGIQSLLALFPAEVYKTRNTTFRIEEAEVKDAPRFPYRGFHLDVSRNFSKKETVLKLIDLLAFYKINTLHLHLTDDEGWRIEIPSLPELTEIGSKRGHTLKNDVQLQPSYGSGPVADPDKSAGTGYYTRQDYIDILQHALKRHIQVIPEINVPGHSRAAIKAMENRYQRLMDEGNTEAALEYRLADPNDSSVYSSAQMYNDNVICVALESVYRFYETVVTDLKAVYDEAGMPLTFIHTGGDEVPHGVWERSPECIRLLQDHPEIGDPRNLQGYFLERLTDVLRKYDLIIGGWEEVAMLIGEDGWKPNPAFIGQKVVPFVWNSLGSNLNLGYRLANAGYPVILCNVNNFYFDLSYSPDPGEPGLYWGGFVDTRKAFDFIPYDAFKSSLWDERGRPVVPEEAYRDMERLKPEARKNIMGLQAELWSETLKNQDMLEYSALPKLLGFAERAWSQAPAYETIENTAERVKSVDLAWNRFVNQVGLYEFPRLDYLFGGFNYRIAPPGAMIENGILSANTDFPGFTIRYTTDGSEPDQNSKLFSEPVEVSGTVKLKAFNGKGRSSRTVEVMSNE
jgi:hexosaminidase